MPLKYHFFLLFLILNVGVFHTSLGQKSAFAPFQEKRKWGVINQKEEVIIAPKYDEIQILKGYFFKVRKKQNWGLVDSLGKRIVPLKYGPLIYFIADTLVRVEKSRKQGIYSLDRGKIAGVKYEEIGTFWGGLSRVKRKGRFGFVNLKGEEIIPVIYDTAMAIFQDGVTFVQKNDVWGLITEGGEWVFEPQFSQVNTEAKYGIYRVNKGKKVGYIDGEGNQFLVNNEMFLPEIQAPQSIESLAAEAKNLEKCFKEANIEQDDIEELAESSGFLDFKNSDSPLKIEIASYENRCAWKISTTFTSHTREGDCRYTNGCTAILTKTIYLETEEGKMIHYDSMRKLYPNYE